MKDVANAALSTRAVPSASVLLNRLQARGRLRHLQVLVKLDELRHLRRTAEALGLSQPAVSQLLADLESLMGLPLFERHARGMRPSPAALLLLPLARSMLAALAQTSEVLGALHRRGEGVVRVAAITSAISGLLVHAVPAFSRVHPEVQVHVRECDVDQWPRLLMADEVDVVACRGPAALPPGHGFRPVLDDRFVVACGTDHPLAGRDGVPWQRLLGEVWVVSPTGSAARQAFDRIAALHAMEPAIDPVITRVSALTWALLAGHDRLTLVPYGVVRQLVEAGRLAVIEPASPLPFAPIGLVVPLQGVSAAVARFVAHIEADAGR
jgi:DNA-binding transcriptional LysR family regulator